MPREFPIRVKVCVAGAALLAMWGSLAHFATETRYQNQNRDTYKIALQWQRLDPVRAALPETAVLGYLSDAEGVLASSLLNGTRYALAPRLVREGETEPLVLGNFTRPADYAALGANKGLRIERDFGAGLVLYRREPDK